MPELTPVALTLDVNQSCIDRGIPSNCSNCPIALATNNAINAGQVHQFGLYAKANALRIAIFSQYSPKELYKAKTPEELDQFMERFDLRGSVSPISVEVTFEPTQHAKDMGIQLEAK